MKIIGMYGDKINLKLFISVGMILASFIIAIIGMLEVINKTNEWVLIVLMGINGCFQST